MKPIPLVRKAALAPAVSYLAGEGIPLHRHLRHASLSVPSPEELESLMPLHQLCDFLSSVARAEVIDDLGLRIAGHSGIESLGVFGRLVAQSFTLHECVQSSIELVSSYNSGLRVWLERHGEQVRYCHRHVEHLPQDRITEIVHLGLVNALVCPMHALGPDWRPNRIELESNPIDLSAYFSGFADVPVSFNQGQTSIWADQAALSAPLPRWDAMVCSTANEQEQESFLRSAPAKDPIGQLEQAIESALGRSEVNLGLTAAIVGMSTRTLQRRLSEHGSPFSRLLQGVRFRNAQDLLRDPSMSLTEISKRLGYTDLANFMRAFKRWTGVGPSEFRRLQYENRHR